ncbi:MAG: hypothetical protein AABW64_01760 [Nanoarchaeota archaeon]
MKKGEAESLPFLTLFEVLLIVLFLIASYSIAHKTVSTLYPELEQELLQVTSAYGQELVGEFQPTNQQSPNQQPSLQP